MSYLFEIIDDLDNATFNELATQNIDEIKEFVQNRIALGNSAFADRLDEKEYFRAGFPQMKNEHNGFYVKATKTESNGSISLVSVMVAYIQDGVFKVPLGLATTDAVTATDPEAYHTYFEFAKAQGCETFVWESHPDVRIWFYFKQIGPHLDYPVTYLEEGDSATMTIDLR